MSDTATSEARNKPKVFISYNRADREWAEWIAGVLESAGCEPIIQAWHFRPGENFVLRMHEVARDSDFTIAVLTDNYLKADFTHPEWAAAFAQDATGKQRKLIPVRVADCKPDGLLAQVIYIDLDGLNEAIARQTLLAGLQPTGKPPGPIPFPGQPAAGPKSLAPFPPSLGLLHNVPNLPPNFLARDTDLPALKAKVLAGSQQPIGITSITSAPAPQHSASPLQRAGLHGMGGIGKTVLAAVLAHDPAVRTAFLDGIFWLTISQTPDLLSRQHQLAQALTGQPQVLRDLQHGRGVLGGAGEPKLFCLAGRAA